MQNTSWIFYVFVLLKKCLLNYYNYIISVSSEIRTLFKKNIDIKYIKYWISIKIKLLSSFANYFSVKFGPPPSPPSPPSSGGYHSPPSSSSNYGIPPPPPNPPAGYGLPAPVPPSPPAGYVLPRVPPSQPSGYVPPRIPPSQPAGYVPPRVPPSPPAGYIPPHFTLPSNGQQSSSDTSSSDSGIGGSVLIHPMLNNYPYSDNLPPVDFDVPEPADYIMPPRRKYHGGLYIN